MKKIKLSAFLCASVLFGCSSCNKDSLPPKTTSTTTTTTTTSTPAKTTTTVAPVTTTSGSSDIFLANWVPKSFTVPTSTSVSKPTGAAVTTINIDESKLLNKVSNNINGGNVNTFTGQMTDPNLISNIKNLNPGLIRYPGGDISDTYFWDEPNGSLPGDVPKNVYVSNGDSTTNYFWYGQNTQSWTLSLNNYYSMLQKTGSQGVITVNYAYARYGTGPTPVTTAAHYAAQWVRYDKGRTKYWEVGNESYGYWESGWKINTATNQDGQPMQMTGALYGKHFEIFADSMRKAAADVGATIYIGAVMVCQTSAASSAINPAEAGWNAGVIANDGNTPDYYSVHDYYTLANDAPTILSSGVAETQNLKNYMATSTSASQKPLAETEWNIFSSGSYQKVSQISGIHAVLVQGSMINDGINMATRFDFLDSWENGNSFGTFSIGDEPDNPTLWNPRPLFYYMSYFKNLVGDQMLSSSITGSSNIVCFASKYSTGTAATSAIVVNKGSTDQVVTINIANGSTLTNYYYYVLQGDNVNTFSRKVYVNGQGPTGASGGPLNYATIPANKAAVSGGIKVTVPNNSVVYLVAQ